MNHTGARCRAPSPAQYRPSRTSADGETSLHANARAAAGGLTWLRWSGAILVLSLAGAAPLAHATGCPAFTPPPDPPRASPPVRPYVRLDAAYPDRAEMPLGVGHIRPAHDYLWGWQERVRLPLHAAPRGEVKGFIHDGWLQPGPPGDAAPWVPLGTEGLLETAYEAPSFLVLERRADGWVHFRFGPPGEDAGQGTAWVHECQLAGHVPPLRFESWAQRLLSPEISPLYFRSAVPHRLRAAPQPDATVLAVVAGSHHLEPLEVRGDWMRVIVRQPSDYCASGTMAVVTREGWVKWRSPGKGPWVWYYTRGC